MECAFYGLKNFQQKKTKVPIVPFIIAHIQQLETSFSSISLPHPGEEEEEGGGSKGRNGATCGWMPVICER